MTHGAHTSQDGIADKRNSDTETETHLGLPGHCMSKAVSRGLVVSFQLVSQGLVVSQTGSPPAGGGALHPSSLEPILQLWGHGHHQTRPHQGVYHSKSYKLEALSLLISTLLYFSSCSLSQSTFSWQILFPCHCWGLFRQKKISVHKLLPLSLSLSVTRVSGFSEMSVFVQIWQLGLTFLDLRFSLNLRNLRYFCKKLLSQHPRVTRECQPDCHSALLDAFPVSCLKCHPFHPSNARFLFLRESGKLKLAAG